MRGANGSPVNFDGPMDFEKNDMMDWLDDGIAMRTPLDVILPITLSSIADLDIYLAQVAKSSAILVKFSFLRGNELENRLMCKI